MAENEIIAGLDLGTTKVCAIVAEQSEEGLDIIGIGSVPSKGLKKGVVVNIESTVQAIRAAVEQAETMAGVEINTVYAGVAGSHVRSLNSHGIVAIRDKEVSAGAGRAMEGSGSPIYRSKKPPKKSFPLKQFLIYSAIGQSGFCPL